MIPAELAFWTSLGVLVYTYLGYPAILFLWARFRPWKSARRTFEPSMTVLVVAYNEERQIHARIANILGCDYPRDRLEVIIACDGATDATATIASQFAHHGVRVVECTSRRGKSAVLSEIIPRASGEIVVLADSRQRFAKDALLRLASGFADEKVGGVSGELVVLEERSRSPIGGGSGFYWRYETLLRRCEGIIDSTVGATGPIYAIRRSLFLPLPPTILDDVLIPLNIVRQGYRVLFDPSAIAYEHIIRTARAEFTRKIRTISGSYQLLFKHPWVFVPHMNRLWLQTLSHKGFRLLGPPCLAAMLAASVALSAFPLYRILLGAQLIFYSAAILGRLMRNSKFNLMPLNVAYVFCLLNLATVVALFRALRLNRRVTWEPTRG